MTDLKARRLAAGACVALACGASTAAAAPLTGGHLVVTDYAGFADGNGGLIDVDPATGVRTAVSSNGGPLGSPFFNQPVATAFAPDGELLTVEQDGSDLLGTNPETGVRRLVSGAGRGTGPALQSPNGIAVAPDGTIYVADFSVEGVLKVDPTTGNRTIVSSSSVGTGPALDSPSSIAREPDGSLIVADVGSLTPVLKVDPATGNRTALMSFGDGGTPTRLFYGFGLALEADGDVLVADALSDNVVRINPVTKARAILADAAHGTGTPLDYPASLTVAPDGTIYAGQDGPSGVGSTTTTQDGNVIAIDPTTGNRTLVSANGSPAGGPGLTDEYGITMAPAFSAPTFTSASQATVKPGEGFTVTTNAGVPATTTLSATGLPSGETFTDRGNGTGVISGSGAPGTYALALTAANARRSTTQAFTLTIPAPPAVTAIPAPPAPATPAAPAPPPTAKPACTSARKETIHLTLGAPRAAKLARTVVRVNGKVVTTLGRGTTRFTLSLAGRPAGTVKVTFRATTTRHTTLTGSRTYRLCGDTTSPLVKLTTLH